MGVGSRVHAKTQTAKKGKALIAPELEPGEEARSVGTGSALRAETAGFRIAGLPE